MKDISGELLIFLKTQGYLKRENSLDEHDSLTGTGIIDSIIILEMVHFLETKYRINIPLEMVTSENFDTLAQISQLVMKLQK